MPRARHAVPLRTLVRQAGVAPLGMTAWLSFEEELDGAGGGGCCGGGGFGADAENFALVGFEDFEAKTVSVNDFAGFGDVASYAIEETGDGGGGGMLHAGVELDAEKLIDLVELDAAAHDQGAAGFANHVRSRNAIFFADFADDFFDQIFHGDDTRHQAVFVNDDGHLLIFALQFLQ